MTSSETVPKLYAAHLNLEKVAADKHASYMLRLMMAVNDMASMRYFDVLIDGDRQARKRLWKAQDGQALFMLRLQASFLVEAMWAFVEQRPKETREYVEELEKAESTIATLFSSLQDLRKQKEFKWLQDFRNTFGFHYGYEEPKLTIDALGGLITETSCKGEDPKKYPSVQTSAQDRLDFDVYRYILADDLLIKAWRQICDDIPEGTPEAVKRLKELAEYVSKLKKTFMEYGWRVTTAWAYYECLRDGKGQDEIPESAPARNPEAN